MCHTFVRSDSLSGVLISDHEYPQRVTQTLLTKVRKSCHLFPQENYKRLLTILQL